jgi:hypothetical protein
MTPWVRTQLQILPRSGASDMASPLLPSRHSTVFSHAPVKQKALADAVSILRRLRANVLIVGEPDAIESALEYISPHLAEPVAEWSPWTSPTWPDEPFRTLIVSHVDEMSLEQQQQLMSLNDRGDGELQVISTAKAPLFAVVEQNAFLERLYYQLNVLLLDLTNR